MSIHASATFCDDIRYEADGKVTLVGCYTGAMLIFGDPPFTLPKFGVGLHFKIPASEISGDVMLINLFPPHDCENPIFNASLEIPKITPEQIASAPRAEEGAEIKAHFNFFTTLLGVELKELGFFRLRGSYGGQELRIADLMVIKATQQVLA